MELLHTCTCSFESQGKPPQQGTRVSARLKSLSTRILPPVACGGRSAFSQLACVLERDAPLMIRWSRTKTCRLATVCLTGQSGADPILDTKLGDLPPPKGLMKKIVVLRSHADVKHAKARAGAYVTFSTAGGPTSCAVARGRVPVMGARKRLVGSQ